MSTEAVPNETENGLRTYRIVYRTASRETVTERHCDRQSRQLPNDDYRIAFNGGRRNLGLGSHLPKAPTGMFTKRLTDMIAERPYWRPTSLLGRCWRNIKITTDGHRVRATGCKRWSEKSRVAHRAMHEGRESANALEYICGMNDHFTRRLQDRYEVMYDWPSPTAIIPKQLRKQQQWSQMGRACGVHEELGELEC